MVSTGDRLYHVAGDFSVWSCESCSLLRVWPPPERLADPVAALAAVAQCLAPAGVAIIREPNVDGVLARVCGPDWYQPDAPRHLCGFGREGLSLLFGKVGLSVRTGWVPDTAGWGDSLPVVAEHAPK
jgi:hypothetical protein